MFCLLFTEYSFAGQIGVLTHLVLAADGTAGEKRFTDLKVTLYINCIEDCKYTWLE